MWGKKPSCARQKTATGWQGSTSQDAGAAPHDMCPTSSQRDIARLYISKLWNDFAHDLSENRTRAARELVNDRPARTLLLKNENSFFKSDKTDEYPLAHGPTMSIYMLSI
jgi:hypothetical protein